MPNYIPIPKLYFKVRDLLSPIQRDVYLCYASEMTFTKRTVKRSYLTIALRLNCCDLTVKRATHVLREMGLIVMKEPSKPNGVPAVYQFVEPDKDDVDAIAQRIRSRFKKMEKRPYGRNLQTSEECSDGSSSNGD